MPITKSAKKSAKRALKLRARNNDFKIRMKMAIKKFKKNIEKGNEVKLEDLSNVYKVIDKCQKVGIIKQRTAGRKKSNMSKLFNSTKIKK
ncbi:MAG: 30S ribosomal protein S20 [candidate division SR1 bacterium]|nr:MAG: 30S ribosomal protein S20 [candidate division SR1 bacterium]